MAFSASLDLAITDQTHQRVFLFDPRGRLVRTVGTKGSGPGEFRTVGDPLFVSSRTLAVFDDTHRTAQVFDISTGELLDAIATGPRTHSPILVDDALFFGASNVETGTLAARWRPGDSALWLFGNRPSAYNDYPALSGTYGIISLTKGRDGIVIAVPGLDSIYLQSAVDGSRLGQVWLPAVRRRPSTTSPEELHRRFGVPRDPAEMWQSTSFLMGIHALSSGEVLVLHMDQDLAGRAISSHPFVSLLSADLRFACLDAPISLESDARIVYAFYRDDLLLLSQDSNQGAVHTQIHRYRVSSEGCAWHKL